MPLSPAYGSDSDGNEGGSVSKDMFFSSTSERDVFGLSNPDRLVQGVTCSVATGADTYTYFQYDEEAATWRSADLIFKGQDGLDGANGKSAYQVAVDNGFTGTAEEWLLSIKGDDGADGPQGESGIDGADGADGADGKSAYRSAIDGGYTGTETEFNTRMLSTPLTAEETAREIESLLYADKLDAVNGLKNLSSAVRDNIGRNRGNIDYISGMSQFDNTRTDDRWYAAVDGSIGGITFSVGDELVALEEISVSASLAGPEWQVKSTPISIASDTVVGGVKLDLDNFDIDVDGVLSLDESVLTDSALAQQHTDADAGIKPVASSVLLSALDDDAIKKSVVGVDKAGIITNTTASYTTEEKTKLSNLDAKWQGSFADEAALVAAIPIPSAGWGAIVRSTGTVWAESGGVWVDTQAGSFGDMLAATYDPASISANVYDRANHTGQQLKSTVTGLDADLTQIATDRADDLARITSAEAGIDAAEADIATANTGIADNLASINTLNTSFAAMNTRVSGSESAIADLESDDEAQDTKIAALESSSTTYATRIHDVEVKSNANETAITTKHDTIDAGNKLSATLVGNGDVSNAEFSQLDGLNVNVQNEFNSIRANEWKLVAMVEFLDAQTFAATDILLIPEVHTAITIEKSTSNVGYEVRVRKTSTTDTFIHGEVTHRVNDRGSSSTQPDSQMTRTYITRNMFGSGDSTKLVDNMRDYNSVDIVLTINLEWLNADGTVTSDGFMCHLRISRAYGGTAAYTDRHAIYAKVERVATDNTHLHIKGS